MNKTICTVQFLCPAFLGDAQQQGAWRTPPFKAALRQWWRVLLAGQGRSHTEIREREARLFGNAWPDQMSCKSRVRLRLSQWRPGRLTGPAAVGKISNGPNQVAGDLYLGYGAVAYDRKTKRTQLEHAPAINAGETAELRIGVMPPEGEGAEDAKDIASALALMSRYATIGGRSRNAWGSFVLTGEHIAADTATILLDWREALAQQWARGIGRDANGPLIWRTGAKNSWQEAMQTLAQLRSDLNRRFGDTPTRALLSYPVTKKNLDGWDTQIRLPNSLRFKIVLDGERLQGLVFHMPCRPKDKLWDKHPHNAAELEGVWRSVHEQIDQRQEFRRVSA